MTKLLHVCDQCGKEVRSDINLNEPEGAPSGWITFTIGSGVESVTRLLCGLACMEAYGKERREPAGPEMVQFTGRIERVEGGPGWPRCSSWRVVAE